MRSCVARMLTRQLVPFKKLSKHHQDEATQEFLDKAPLQVTSPPPRPVLHPVIAADSSGLLDSQFLMQTLSSSHGPCVSCLGMHCCRSSLCSDTESAPHLTICSCLDTVVIKTHKHPSEKSLSTFHLALRASHKILTGGQYSQVYPDIGK